ncbi:class I adenylate-forming enzyme family protein [Streptomyces sp. NPDC019531]|uniref:class I adenylate-forming enzyme family protein n=1 Tax=Streptomyces sp. NPDC019531 TaxID=3365062 RepID=UPI00384CAF3A
MTDFSEVTEITDLPARVASFASSAPRRPAVVSPDAAINYGDLALRAQRRADQWRGEGGPGRRHLVAGCPVEVAVSVVAAAAAGVGLLLLDAEGRLPEHVRAQDIFRAAPDTATPGLGLTTSGVSGPPKCVERPWSAVAGNAAAFAYALSLAPGEVMLCTTPPHHSYAVCGGIITALMAGATYAGTARRTGPKALAATLDEQRVDLLLSVPLLYQWYATGLAARRVPRLCVSAGSPLTPEHRAAWERGVGWPLVEHFGTSEYGMLTHDTEGLSGSVGRAVPGIALSLAPGPAGDEVVVHAAGAPARLLDEGGRAELLGVPGRTGDLGAFDDAGRLTLLGRVGSVINVAGNKVSSTEVEAAVRRYAPVKDCALVGDTSTPGATRLCLFVEAGDAFDRQELMNHLVSSLAPYKVPQVVHRTDGLPRSAAGKVLRSELLRILHG